MNNLAGSTRLGPGVRALRESRSAKIMNKPIEPLATVSLGTIVVGGAQLEQWCRGFRVFLTPDPEHASLAVGMCFNVLSVNRQTGEVLFGTSYEDGLCDAILRAK